MNAALLKKMREMGLTLDQAIELAEAWEEGCAKEPALLSKGALRTRKWREGKSAETSRGDVTVTHHGDVTPVTVSPAPSLSPPDPPNPAPTPVSVNTSREREAREEAAWGKFWADYPRKVCKAEARKAFTKAWRKLPPFDEEAVLIGGLERAKAAWVDAQFIPHAATWLNGERWQDEPTVIELQPRKAHERPHPDDKLARKEANLARAFAASGRAAGQRWEP